MTLCFQLLNVGLVVVVNMEIDTKEALPYLANTAKFKYEYLLESTGTSEGISLEIFHWW